MEFKCWLEQEENIKTWLGNSTIQNVVYHGTNKNTFNQFSYQKSKRFILFSEFDVESKGFFFAESPHDALEYGKNVASCYVRMLNPLLDPRKDKDLGINRLTYQKEMHLLKILAPMIERDDYGHYIELGINKHYLHTRLDEFAYQWIYHAVAHGGLAWDCLDNPGVIERMTSLGYDGTFVEEPESSIGRSIFVPSADQIKIDMWHKGKQDIWKHKDDYRVKKKNGLSLFYNET